VYRFQLLSEFDGEIKIEIFDKQGRFIRSIAGQTAIRGISEAAKLLQIRQETVHWNF
jgi:hypothetical protein